MDIWKKIRDLIILFIALREKCPYTEFFYSIFLRIRIEYGEIFCWNTENAD